MRNANGQPITQASQTALNSPDQLALHTYGAQFDTRWVTIHDTATDGTTLVQRQRPGHGRRRHAVQATGERTVPTRIALRRVLLRRDRRHRTHQPRERHGRRLGVGVPAAASRPGRRHRHAVAVLQGRPVNAGFDNVTFLSKNLVTFVEDAGDTLHTQRNALDSGWVFDADPRLLQRRDPARSGGSPRAATRRPPSTPPRRYGQRRRQRAHRRPRLRRRPGPGGHPRRQGPPAQQRSKWRWFYTQQHGDNATYEVTLSH